MDEILIGIIGILSLSFLGIGAYFWVKTALQINQAIKILDKSAEFGIMTQAIAEQNNKIVELSRENEKLRSQLEEALMD